MKDLANKIRDLRVAAGLSQPQLAEKIGVSKAVVSFWENDINEPKARYLKALALCFGVSADFLLGLEE